MTNPTPASQLDGPPGSERLLKTVAVVGVGGGGSNAVNHMFLNPAPKVEIRYVALNTDSQHLGRVALDERAVIGAGLTKGLGAGGNPEIGLHAAQESEDLIREYIADADLVFVAAGMGGGTGTGAAPMVARLAREQGSLTIAVVTLPFRFEGNRRMATALGGLNQLAEAANATIVIPNDLLLESDEGRLPAAAAFARADAHMKEGVQSLARLVAVPGDLTVGFNQYKAALEDSMVGRLAYGEAETIDLAMHRALHSQMLTVTGEQDSPMESALLSVSIGPEVTLEMVSEAYDVARLGLAGSNILFGLVTDAAFAGKAKVSLVGMWSQAGEGHGLADAGNRSAADAELEATLETLSKLEDALASYHQDWVLGNLASIEAVENELGKGVKLPFTDKRLMSAEALAEAVETLRSLRASGESHPYSLGEIAQLVYELRQLVSHQGSVERR